MSWLRDNWPSFSNQWDLPFGTLTDLIGIGLGFVVLCLTIYVAMRQLEIMTRQTAMMEEQNEASKRIEALTIEQAAIVKRQAAIAVKQDRLADIQLSRRSRLRMVVRVAVDEEDGWCRFPVSIANHGTRTAFHCYWSAFIPLQLKTTTEFHVEGAVSLDSPTTLLEPDERASSPDWFTGFRGSLSRPVYPGLSEEIGYVLVRPEWHDDFYLRWGVHCEDGSFPEDDRFGVAKPTWNMFGDVDNSAVDNSDPQVLIS